MNDPRRLRELGGIGIDLLDSARGDGPSAASKRAAASALGLSAATTITAAASAKASVAIATKAGATPSGIGSAAAVARAGWGVAAVTVLSAGVATTAIAAGSVHYATREPAPNVSSAPSTSTARSSVVQRDSRRAQKGAIETPNAPPADAQKQELSNTKAEESSPQPLTTIRPPAQRSALVARPAERRAGEAISILEGRPKSDASGLTTAAEAMSIEALVSAGRIDEARARAEAFFARAPNAPEAARVRAALQRVRKEPSAPQN